MIKSDEIMVGNLVFKPKKGKGSYIGTYKPQEYSELETFNPVMLTAELMKKTEFTDSELAHYGLKIYVDGMPCELCVSFETDDITTVSLYDKTDDFSVYFECEYVHQLQIIHYSLVHKQLYFTL
jgi:hypothetical protein